MYGRTLLCRVNALNPAGARRWSRSTRAHCSTTRNSTNCRAASCHSQGAASSPWTEYSRTATRTLSRTPRNAARAGRSRRAPGACCSSDRPRTKTGSCGSIASTRRTSSTQRTVGAAHRPRPHDFNSNCICAEARLKARVGAVARRPRRGIRWTRVNCSTMISMHMHSSSNATVTSRRPR